MDSIYRVEEPAFVTTYGLSVIGALVLLVAGWVVAGWERPTGVDQHSVCSKWSLAV